MRTIGVRAVIPLYEGGLVESRTRQAASIATQRQEEVKEARRMVRMRMLTFWRQLEATQQEILAREVTIDTAKSAREGVREEARLGERTVIDVLDAEQEVLEAEAALIQSRRDEMIARIGIAATLGQLPNF